MMIHVLAGILRMIHHQWKFRESNHSTLSERRDSPGRTLGRINKEWMKNQNISIRQEK